MLFNLNAKTSKDEIIFSVLEGVANSFRDGLNCLTESGADIKKALIVGGGSRSPYWLELIASALNINLEIPNNAEVGGAIGASRLAMIGAGNNINTVITPNTIKKVITPNEKLTKFLKTRYDLFKDLYHSTKELKNKSN